MNLFIFILILLYLVYSWKTFSKEYFLKRIQTFNSLTLIFVMFLLYKFNFELYLVTLILSFAFLFTEETKERMFFNYSLPFLFFINHVFFIFISLSLFLSFFNVPFFLDFLLLCVQPSEEISETTHPGLEVLLKGVHPNKQKSYFEKNNSIKVYVQEEIKQKVKKHFSDTPLILQQQDIKNNANAVMCYVTHLTENSLQNQHKSPMEGAAVSYENLFKKKFPLESEKQVDAFKVFIEEVNKLTIPHKEFKPFLPWYVMPTVNSIALMEPRDISPAYAASVFYSQERIFNDISAQKLLEHYLNIPNKGTPDASSLVAVDKKGRMMGSHFSEITYKAIKGESVVKIIQQVPGKPMADFEPVGQEGKEIEVKLLNIHNDHKILPFIIHFENNPNKDFEGLLDKIVQQSQTLDKALRSKHQNSIIALDCCILVDFFKHYGKSEEETLSLFYKTLENKGGKDKFELFCTK